MMCAFVGTESLRRGLEVYIAYGRCVSTLISDTALQLPAINKFFFIVLNKTLLKQSNQGWWGAPNV